MLHYNIYRLSMDSGPMVLCSKPVGSAERSHSGCICRTHGLSGFPACCFLRKPSKASIRLKITASGTEPPWMPRHKRNNIQRELLGKKIIIMTGLKNLSELHSSSDACGIRGPHGSRQWSTTCCIRTLGKTSELWKALLKRSMEILFKGPREALEDFQILRAPR